MPQITIGETSRVVHDAHSGALRSWFDPSAEVFAKAPFAPRTAAREVLADSAELFKWNAALGDLRETSIVAGPQSFSVRWSQTYKDIPVDASEVVVNLSADGRVHSVYNLYHYDIPRELDPKKAKITAKRAREIAEHLVEEYEQREVSEPKLIVYQYHKIDNQPPKAQARAREDRERIVARIVALRAEAADAGQTPREGQYFLAWDILATSRRPTHSWRVLVDATTGRLIDAVDLLQYASGLASVFDPNPTVTSGDLTLSSASPIATVDAQRLPVTINRLNAAVSGSFTLDGTFVRMEEIESPVFVEPASGVADFSFSSSAREFLDAMVYYHVDSFQHYVQTDLALTNVANFSIPADPQGFNGADNSRYDPVAKDLAFGEGGVPDAADAHVILHEYGHAIQDNVNPGFSNYTSGTSEGFGDFLAAVYYDDKHTNPATTRGKMMSWDAAPFGGATASWSGRRYDVPWLFDGPEFAAANGHDRGQLWCATMFELYRKLGGDSAWLGVKHAARDLTIRLHLQANFNVPTSGATATDMGQQVEIADSNLGGWRYANSLHKKVVYDTFRRRHLPGYTDLPVDVYINDGRNGGYGSPSGNDLFTENLWDENYWDTQDIWVRTTPYANAAAQAAGGPADHIEPPVGSTAYLYVRVQNRGTSAGGSGPVTVKAFHCVSGLGLVWPDAWTPTDTPSIVVANIVPGPANSVVVGPFPWTPTEVGHECILVVAECAQDHAITQDLLPTDQVRHSDLVPFDNNIAQRNLAPTAPKGRMLRGFYVNNPDAQVQTIALHFESSLPKGWVWHTNLANPRAIRLGPLERRWVELVIDQHEGEEVTRFEERQTLRVTGTIGDRVIGGLTFYVAPPSAFGSPSTVIHPGSTSGGQPAPHTHSVSLGELLSLHLPWTGVDFEGEIEARIRFHTK